MPGLRARICAASLIVSLSATAALADASSGQYRGCDGYGAASSDGDGMTELATVLLIFSPPGYGNTARGTTSSGAAGIADCDAALADLPTKHWMRKVSLLRARAMHRLDGNDAAGALADLDLAAAAASNADDPLYTRSLGLGVTFVRAFALRKSGDTKGGETLVLKALEQRPFNRQSIVSAFIAVGPNAPAADIEKVQHTLARLLPTEIDKLFVGALADGKFQEAISLYPQLTPYREIGQVNISEGRLRERAMRDFAAAMLFKTSRAGGYAFALAAMGRNAEAQAVLSSAREELKHDSEVPPLDPSLSPSERARQTAYREEETASRQKAVAAAGKSLDIWSAFAGLRQAIDQGKAADVLKGLQSQTGRHGWPDIQLLDAILAKLPKSDKASIAAAQAMKASWGAITVTSQEAGLDTFFKALPEPETLNRVPRYEPGRQPLFGTSDRYAGMIANGYQQRGPDADGILTVSFRGENSTASMIEEMALLRAADLARQAGKKGIIIVDRHDTAFTISTESYGTVVRTDPDGYETDLDVLFVDPNVLPEKYRDHAWRVIDTDAAYNSLAPVYIRPKASKKPGADVGD
jgi:hypothetical protein